MKKTLLTALSIITLTSVSFGWSFDLGVGTFFDNSGNMIQEEYGFALIVDVNNKGFGGDFKLTEGNSFVKGTYVDSTTKDYMTIFTGNLSDQDGAGFFLAYSYGSPNYDNANYGFKGGEEIALVVWNTKDEILFANDMYTIINPAYTDTTYTISSSDTWEVPITTDAPVLQPKLWYLSNKSIEGDTSDSFFTLNKKVGVIPEPSTYASLLGFGALAFTLWRRKK